MDKKKYCKGVKCTAKKQCRWFRLWLKEIADGNTTEPATNHCVDQKRFERYELDHPQMKGSYPRGC